jgi:DeoR family galactitol utilization operon repressor
MIEAGTTTALITRYFLGKRDLHVVTNSMLVISFARFNPAIRVTVVGGEFRASTESVVGPLAAKGLDEFHVGTAFIGTDGFSMEHGLTTHLVEGAEIVRKMREQSDRTVLVADSSKYGKAGFTRILPINAIDHLVTDVELPPDAARAIRDLGPTVDLV